MNLESHERAKQLLSAVLVEGISGEDGGWLDAHLAGCTECSAHQAALDRAIGSLCSFSVTASPDAVRRARLAVHARAEQLRIEREQAAPLWIAVVLSSALAILTTPHAWSAFAWLGGFLEVPAVVWQTAFLMWWFLPATPLAAAAGWGRVRAAEMDWRSV